ncbi:MAG: hypothetical protein AAGB29_02245 [Planctomycetota bacterium]
MHLPTLLAQADKPLRRGPMIDVASISKHFGDERESLIDPVPGLIALGVVIAGVIALAAWRWWRRRSERSRPGWLLGELRQSLGLSHAEARLLRRVAAARGLPHALTLVLDREVYEFHLAEFFREQPAQADQCRHTLTQLAERVFPQAETPGDPTAA